MKILTVPVQSAYKRTVILSWASKPHCTGSYIAMKSLESAWDSVLTSVIHNLRIIPQGTNQSNNKGHANKDNQQVLSLPLTSEEIKQPRRESLIPPECGITPLFFMASPIRLLFLAVFVSLPLHSLGPSTIFCCFLAKQESARVIGVAIQSLP